MSDSNTTARPYFRTPNLSSHGAQTYGDLEAIIGLMVGELRASHLGFSGGGGITGSDGATGLLFDPTEQARCCRRQSSAAREPLRNSRR